MSNEKHTQGPLMLDTCPRCNVHDLRLNGESILQSHYVGDSYDGYHEGAVSELDVARRLVACWNACQGIGTLQLESLRFPLLELHKKELDLQVQRDELLAALEGVMYWDNGKPEWDVARGTIAKVKGGAT